ncbi:ribonuclease H-like domain-containing protein [Tanacetum coccineum]
MYNSINLHVSSVSPLPKSYRDAFSDPNWQNVMRDEYTALIKNKTWTLVPKPPDTNIVRCMWLFRHKYLADGTLSRYKARLVANGSTQLEGVDVDETFSLVVKVGTIRTVLGIDTAYLLVYVDDIVLTASSEGLFLSKKKYAIEILEKAHMVSCKPSRTPVDSESKLGVDGDPVSDRTLYRSLVGSLKYLTFTRSDIFYAVQHVCLHMHDPQEPHLYALKRILRYVQGTLNYGLQLFSSSTTDFVAYSFADWVGCPTTRRSTSEYCCQPTLSRSSNEVEYRGVANAVAETCWLRNLLPSAYKNIEIDIHFVRDLVAAGQVQVLHVPSRYQFADIFTKGLPSALFKEFRSSLSFSDAKRDESGDADMNSLSDTTKFASDVNANSVSDTKKFER